MSNITDNSDNSTRPNITETDLRNDTDIGDPRTQDDSRNNSIRVDNSTLVNDTMD